MPTRTSASFASLVQRFAAAALLALLPLAGGAQSTAWETGTDGLKPIPPLSARVTDLTGTLSASERQTLEAKLAKWESETGNQLAVLLVPTTQPEPIEAYSIRVADAWKIGRKGRDNGALLLVAKDDRKLRIEVGYGFEGVLTDATSRRIIAETITPLFRQNQFAAGINAGVDRIIGVIGKGEPLAAPAQRSTSRGGGFNLEMLLILVFVVVPILGGVLRRIFGKFGGATIGAGVVGAGAWIVAGSILIGIAAAVIAWIVLLFLGMGGGTGGLTRSGRRGGWGGGPWIGGGGWGGGGSWGGGGGWSGGGGGFGGGGASGGW
jgi:uncharacterized protein